MDDAPAQTPPAPEPNPTEGHNTYQPALWEKITVAVAVAFVLFLVGFLLIRNEPFADPNYVVFVRIVLSLAVASLGATVPGFLHIDIKGTGFWIRAGGALALFVLSFFWTPNVLDPYISPKPGVRNEVFEGADFLGDVDTTSLAGARAGEMQAWLEWITGYLGEHIPPQDEQQSRKVVSTKTTLTRENTGFSATMLVPNDKGLLATAFLVRYRDDERLYVPIALSEQTNVANKYYAFDVPPHRMNDHLLFIVGGVRKDLKPTDEMFKVRPNKGEE